MSQHSSLRSKAKDTVHRSVLKRYERLKTLKEKEKWDVEKSVYGLPKQKIVKFKVKKEKSAEAAAAKEGAEGQAAAAPAAAPEAAKKADAKAKDTKK